MNELRNRGVHDILIAVVDGLKGFPEAITAAFPETTVQTCSPATGREPSRQHQRPCRDYPGQWTQVGRRRDP